MLPASQETRPGADGGTHVSTRLQMPQVERREANAPIARCVHASQQGVRLKTAPSGAPLPRVSEGKTEGAPRALQRTGVAKRWLTANRMIPKKPAPDLIRGGNRFSDKIMLKRNAQSLKQRCAAMA